MSESVLAMPRNVLRGTGASSQPGFHAQLW